MYDVTKYIKDHPGGAEPLIEVAGQDATSAYEDVGHSEDAREILHSFLIGTLEGYSAEDASDTKQKPLPDVHIATTGGISAQPKGSTALLSPRAELFTFALGTAGIVYAANVWHVLPSLAKVVPNGHRGFLLGYSTAILSFSVVGIACLRYLSKNGDQGRSDFTSYPAHIASTSFGTAPRLAGALSPSEYRKLKLRSKEELADDIWRFVLDLPTKYSMLGLPTGQHVAIKGTIDEHTVVRSYTPISNNRDLGRLELLIKVYPDGKMGNFLKNMAEGTTIEVRGPKGAMKYRRDMSKRIGMIGGGTGITPLFQVIRKVCEDENDNTQIDLLYGNRTEADIMLRERLDQYAKAHPDKFRVFYILGSPPPGWKGRECRIDKALIEERLPPPHRDNKILLCGPPGMVKAMTQSLIELGFEQPGAVSKMSDQVFCF